MRRISVTPLHAWFLTSLLLSAAVSLAQIAPQDRIVQAIDSSQMRPLRGNVHPLANPSREQGRVNPGMEMQGVSMMFKLSPSQQADLDQLLAQQQDPTSPNYHKWLTPEQYAARFGMTQGDLDRIINWLQSQGFTEIQVARGRTRISFTGTAARVEAAFRTEIHNYQVDGGMHFANAIDPALPAAFADTVLAFRHLDNFRPKPRLRPNAHFTSSQSGNHFLTPGDFATIYDIGPLYSAGIDGTGITIAVVGQTQIDVSDANKFRSLSGLSVNPPQLFLTPNTGVSQTFTSDLDEANIDVEWSGGVAKNATVIFDYAGATGNVFDALFDAIDNNRTPIISISYGNCESMIGTPTVVQGIRTEVQQGVLQGQTVSAASGDDGAADCDGNDPTPVTVASHGLSVDVPAAIPEVVGVGGTEFMGDNTAGSDPPFWAAATNGTTDNISSALQYIPERAWNDTAVAITNGGDLSASGGGVSTMFTKPSWQTALTPADGQRDVPDISVSGSNGHDSYLVCSQGSCVNGFRDSSGGLDAFGGTSVSAQAFGGILALINQATKPSKGLGNVNAVLYTLAANTSAAFHDVTTGDNKVPCTSGTTNCPAGTTQIGFSAGTGYDLVTGLGSVDVNVLTRAWPGFNLTATSTTTVVTSSALSAAAGANVTFTATITPGATNDVDITGSVQFMDGGTNLGSAVAVAFSGTASAFVATFSTTTLGTGAHTITAVYSGASPNYAGSTSAAITETITGGFTVTGSAITIAAPGGSGTSTITVAPGAGFTGMVTLSCTTPGSEIACSFTAPTAGATTSVNITGAGNATATLSVTTVAAHAIASPSANARPSARLGWFAASGGALLAGFFVIGVPTRRRRSVALMGLLFCVFLAVGVGCGGGSSSTGSGSGQSDPGTPLGNYTIVVTGTAGAVTKTASVSVAVQ